MNINELIGEATAYDKKRQLEVKRPKSWLKSVSAFSSNATEFHVTLWNLNYGADVVKDNSHVIKEVNDVVKMVFGKYWMTNIKGSSKEYKR